METTPNGAQRTPNPRRRRRDPKRVFIQTYLLPIAIILILIQFICSSHYRTSVKHSG